MDSVFAVLTDQVRVAFHLVGIPYAGVLFFPESRWTRRLVFGFVISVGLIYGSILVYKHPNLLQVVLYYYSTSQGFSEFLSDPAIAFISYLQIIGWDLLVGYWISRDAYRIGMPGVARVVYLCFYMHYPPAMLVLYLAGRYLKFRKLPDLVPDTLPRRPVNAGDVPLAE